MLSWGGGLSAFLISLTFFSPIFWAPLAIIIAFMLVIQISLFDFRRVHISLVIISLFMAMIIVLQLAWSAANDFYNIIHILFVLISFVMALNLCKFRDNSPLPWLPFAIFAAYFSSCALLGVPSDTVLVRNSENFISVILLSLFSYAILASKPSKPNWKHFVISFIILLNSIYGIGRAGIISSLLLVVIIVVVRIHCVTKNFSYRVILYVGLLGALLVSYHLTLDYIISLGYFDRLTQRGLQDAARLTIWSNYFNGVSGLEWIFGSNIYENTSLSWWDYNLHNSYIAAWAHMGVLYLLLIMVGFFYLIRIHRGPWYIYAVLLSLGPRAFTDIQMLAGKYDFIFISCVLLLVLGVEIRAQPIRFVGR